MTSVATEVLPDDLDENGDFKDKRRRRGAKLKWVPKKWKPAYDQMIILSIMGRKNVQIAEALGYSSIQVGNVLNSLHAEVIRRKLMDQIMEKAGDDIPGRLQVAADLASKRVVDYFRDDQAFTNAPGAMVDRAMKVLAGMKHIKSEGSGGGQTNIKNALFVGDGEITSRLTEAIRQSDQAKQLHGNVGEVVVGSYEEAPEDD